tara:strand:+ start:334 stop:495 length:162 start_codon:yes stop_codon:yes gene_type:complete
MDFCGKIISDQIKKPLTNLSFYIQVNPKIRLCKSAKIGTIIFSQMRAATASLD